MDNVKKYVLTKDSWQGKKGTLFIREECSGDDSIGKFYKRVDGKEIDNMTNLYISDNKINEVKLSLWERFKVWIS